MVSKRKSARSENSDYAKERKIDSCKTLKTNEEHHENGQMEEISVVSVARSPQRRERASSSKKSKRNKEDLECRFLGDPVPMEEAMQRWPHRYIEEKDKGRKLGYKGSEEDEELMQAQCHYLQVEVDGHIIFNLYDDAHVKADEGEPNYICKIVEMFAGVDGMPHFRAQWFYRCNDTKIGDGISLTESKRVFFSEIKDDNPIDCLVEKLNIVRVTANVDITAKLAAIPECDYYYDMLYLLPYSTFIHSPPEHVRACSESLSTISTDPDVEVASDAKSGCEDVCQANVTQGLELNVLDLYSGCGAMSTGLCLGAGLYGINLVTRWAVDTNRYACESLKLNHPETQVRNESVEDFLMLLKEWEKLCMTFSVIKGDNLHKNLLSSSSMEENEGADEDDQVSSEDDPEVFEVQKILGICYGDPKEMGKRGLYFQVRWKGYGPSEDSWEPLVGLGNCQDILREFVKNGYKSRILPLPGAVDVICGGPPCQGISGFNRFRNKENPLEDPKNKQLKVFMDVVDYLKPSYVLMENVVDLLKFAGGFLGRYALGRLVDMNYQARLGMMAAGAYGLPQFRMRVFIWGALPTEKLPQFPLPTHDLVLRGVIPVDFEMCTVAYEEGQALEVETKLFLGDAISDLPSVANDETRDEMPYGSSPKTDFQRFIRLKKDALLGASTLDSNSFIDVLYDHRPLELNEDDYQRVCQIPKTKGANFRHLPGVRVRPDKKVEWDPDVERVYLPSGKPLVPDYAMTFVNGSSSKPFGRLWFDETVPTVVTRAEPHNQIILHPFQDRVLTIRENARLQGFPDYYQLCGPIKERYIQVGNAVAVPVARALGYAFGMANQGCCSDDPVFTLPSKFPNIQERLSSVSVED
ncbi:hypothetical protein Nepgr_013364 [Nepenthes gracilis]|uniref:DNA (cytosine-5-)-methyltransferase n=1 Tax=Nepenthes gracilis TaxID=150966 RepID=A0AAD3SHR5_NEPGR|nr:hypothetical protein Nepgr_013364 [Nepenthes gracilis]